MPRILPKRKAPVVDMTAMCDVAFLLLTFFILTAKFKPQAAVAIDSPAATSTFLPKEDSIVTVLVNKEGRVFVSVKSEPMRVEMIAQLKRYYMGRFPKLKSVDDADISFFRQIEVWGGPINDLHDKLTLSSTEFQTYQQETPGIPYHDSATSEVAEWVNAARYAGGPSMKVAIKGDRDAKAEDVLDVVHRLTEREMHRLILVTTLANSSKD